MIEKEMYTLVSRGNRGSTEFTCFSDREKMKQSILWHISRGDNCYILPGSVNFVGFNVECDESGHAVGIYMEDEPDYIIPIKVFTVAVDSYLGEGKC